MKTQLATFSFVASLLLCASGAAAAPLTFQVVLNTGPLVGHVDGPFSLSFQLNDGSSVPGGNNTAVITDVVFSGAGSGATGLPALTGGATGSLSSSVTLTDSSFLNEFLQTFVAGSSLSFRVALTTNLNQGPTPDAFSIALLDKNLLNIPTNGLGDALLLIDINRVNLGLADIRTFTSTAPAGVAATVVAVPEPVSLLLLGAGLTGLGLRGRRWRAARLRPTTAGS